MTRFNPGDTVRCVEPDSNWLERNKLYRVHDVIDEPNYQLVQVFQNLGILFNSTRFRLVHA